MNRLANEKSPYLLQHRNNPVDWHPWDSVALDKAQAEEKPIFLSIGYSTCYWCHVMEKDSFENQEVADLLNASFVPIKVDREERPDIDQIYMDAVVAMSGHGGWPMSVFLTPDGKPFFGATYIQRPQFAQLLRRVREIWRLKKEEILGTAREIADALGSQAPQAAQQPLDERIFHTAFSFFRSDFDEQYGGFGTAPKFPPSASLNLMLRLWRRSGNEACLKMAKSTLDAMARGGIFDQLGGGFHRYSTDAQWLVPHFEKMLYDNALLASCYIEAGQATGEEHYFTVARATIDYILNEMTDGEGGFYSAQDAGEVNREGEYYVWSSGEVEHALTSEEYELVRRAFDITEAGNFEDQMNVLHLANETPWETAKDPLFLSARSKLLRLRQSRERPHTDDKILTGWNGLMISALSKAASALGEKRYLEAAEKAAAFLQEKLFTNELLHRYREGSADFPAYLEDYSYLIAGLLDLYEASFDVRWFNWARDLQTQEDALFWDEPGGSYYYTSGKDPSLILRKKELHDGAIPSPNSVAALNLLRLYHLSGNEDYKIKAARIFETVSPYIPRYPSAYATLLCAFDFATDKVCEIVVAAASREKGRNDAAPILKAYQPNKAVAFTTGSESQPPVVETRKPGDGATLFYVCREQTCQAPVADAHEALSAVSVKKALEI